MAVARGVWRVARGGAMRLKPRPAAPPAPGKPPPIARLAAGMKLARQDATASGTDHARARVVAPLQCIAAGYRVWHGDRNKFFRQAIDNLN